MIRITQWQGATVLIRDIAIGIVSLLLVAVIVRQVLWRGGLDDKSGFEAEAGRAADYARGIVFQGSSHFALGVDPATFDTTPTGQNLGSRAFDLTLGGMSPVARCGGSPSGSSTFIRAASNMSWSKRRSCKPISAGVPTITCAASYSLTWPMQSTSSA